MTITSRKTRLNRIMSLMLAAIMALGMLTVATATASAATATEAYTPSSGAAYTGLAADYPYPANFYRPTVYTGANSAWWQTSGYAVNYFRTAADKNNYKASVRNEWAATGRMYTETFATGIIFSN